MITRRLIPSLSCWLIAIGTVSPGFAQRDRTPRPAGVDRYERQPQRDRDGGHRLSAAPDHSGPQAGTEEGMPDSDAGALLEFDRFRPGPQWWLGVFAYNTSQGVVITYVVPRSPASRAGFEPGDRIVTVDGFQVGFVNHYRYPLGEELQLRAGSQGQVRLLAQNVRNAKLVNVDVRLERRRYGRVPDRPGRHVPGGEAPDNESRDDDRPWRGPR